jgi:heme/copper-type cytochrome/quinol oxidase subunit 4
MAEETDGQENRPKASFDQTTKFSLALQKMLALLFLIAIALVPFLIVATYSREGGIWVLGYVTGILTVPVVGIAAVRAMNTLSDERAFIGTVVFGFCVILISLATGLWSFFR